MNIAEGLYRSILRSMLGRYSVYVANLLSMMILARIFSPDDFGTVASVMVFFTFFQLLSEVGLGPAIINLSDMKGEDRDGIFSLTLLLGVVLGVFFYCLTPAILAFYKLSGVEVVVPYVAIAVVFFALTIVPSAFLFRDQRFFRVANAGVAAEVLSTTLAIFLSFRVDPLHALASKAACSSVVNFFVIYWFSNDTEFGRPELGRKVSAIKPLLGFSAYQFGFNFVNYFSRNLDNILVGKFMGAASLGVYDKAYQLMRYPLMLLTFAMTPAIQPYVRKYAGDKERVEKIHRDFTFKISIAGALAGLCIFMMADWIVDLMLGAQWGDVVPVIKILAISIPAQVVLSTSGSFFQAMGRADLLFYSGLISAVFMISAIVFGVCQRDLLILSWALVACIHVNFVQAYYIFYSKVLMVGMRAFFVRMIPAGAIATLLAFVGSGFEI